MSHDTDGISTDRTDISSEPAPGAEENDNLGTDDNKGEATAAPSGPASDDEGDVLADDPDAD